MNNSKIEMVALMTLANRGVKKGEVFEVTVQDALDLERGPDPRAERVKPEAAKASKAAK